MNDPFRPPIPSEGRDARQAGGGPSGAVPCALCGLPAERAGIRREVSGTVLHFCCPGCRWVHEVLSALPGGPPADFRATELFRASLAAKLIAQGDPPSNAADAPAVGPPGPPGSRAAPLSSSDTHLLSRELNLRIDGMWCPACSWLIEHALTRLPGVSGAEVSFAADFATVRYLPHRIRPEAVRERIEALGYRSSLFEDEAGPARSDRGLFLRLGIGAILTANIMMISLALYFGFFEDLDEETIRLLSWPVLILTVPVIFWAGRDVLKRGFAALRAGSATMETLIALGALAAFGVSLAAMARGSIHLYFDTASMLVTLTLAGKAIEERARKRAGGSLFELMKLTRGKVRLASETGAERWVSVEEARPGDRFDVLEGERVPLDGRVIEGSAALDESFITGESRPVGKGVGDEVPGGATVIDGTLRLEALRTGEAGTLGRMAALVRGALASKSPVERFSDRISRILVPVVLALAVAVGAVLLATGHTVEEALLRTVTVLVITCPCALGIAAPLAKVAGIEAARRNGILIRDPAALEKAGNLDTIVFDKTGTLTEGRYELREVFAPGMSAEAALLRVAPVEKEAKHFLAREICRKAWDTGLVPEEAVNAREHPGLGAEGVVSGISVSAGGRAFMNIRSLGLPGELDRAAAEREAEGATVVFFGWEGAVRGFFAFGDRDREESAGLVRKLSAEGLETWLVSGDSEATTRAVAGRLGIPRFLGTTLPAGKADFIRSLQEKGRRVAMAGDGVNDAPGIARADVGMSLGTAPGATGDASSLTIPSGNPSKVHTALLLSRYTSRIIRENLLFALVYNLCGIPLAALGLLNPLVAVLAMLASSVTVVRNTLRISRHDFGAEQPGA